MSVDKIVKPNFFNDQQLSADEFLLEQKHLSLMRYRQNIAMHTYGIVNGLELSVDTNTNILTINKGMALAYYTDDNGELLSREILLDNTISLDMRTLSFENTASSFDVAVTIAFTELKATEDPYKSTEFIHIIEKPSVTVYEDLESIDDQQHIILGLVNLTFDDSGKITGTTVFSETVNLSYPVLPGEAGNVALWLEAESNIADNNSELDSWGTLIPEQQNKLTFSPCDKQSSSGITIIGNAINEFQSVKIDGTNGLNLPEDMTGSNLDLQIQEVFIVTKLEAEAHEEAVLLTVDYVAAENDTQQKVLKRRKRGGYSTDMSNDFSYKEAPAESNDDQNKTNTDKKERNLSVNGESTENFETDRYHIVNACADAVLSAVDIAIGCNTNNLNKSWKGEITEIIIFNQKVSDDIRKSILSYLKIKYGIANPHIQPSSVFRTSGAISNQIFFDSSGARLEGSTNSSIIVHADRVLFRSIGGQQQQVEVDKTLEVTSDVTVKGHLVVENVNTTDSKIFTNDMLVNDNIITLNHGGESDADVGIDIFNGPASEKNSYIRWSPVRGWEASDLIAEGAIAADLPDNFTNGENADDLHKHSQISVQGGTDPVLEIQDDSSVTIGGNVDGTDLLRVNGAVQTHGTGQGIEFHDRGVFPVNPLLASVNDQFNDHQYMYSKVIQDTGSKADNTLALQNAIDNDSTILLIGDSSGLFEISDTITISGNFDITITTAPNTRLVLSSENVSVFFKLDKECKNIHFNAIEISSGGTFVSLDGSESAPVISGLRIEQCKQRGDSVSPLLETTGENAPQIAGCEIINNIWTLSTGTVIKIDSVSLVKCKISNNIFVQTQYDLESSALVRLGGASLINLNITANSIDAKTPGIFVSGTTELRSIVVASNQLHVDLTGRGQDENAFLISSDTGPGAGSIVSIVENSLLVKRSDVLNRAFNIMNIDSALMNNNTVYFYDDNGIAVEVSGSNNSIVANNTFGGVEYYHNSTLIDHNNVVFLPRLFPLSMAAYVVQNDEFLPTTGSVEIVSHDIPLWVKDIDGAETLSIADQFDVYDIELRKNGFHTTTYDGTDAAGFSHVYTRAELDQFAAPRSPLAVLFFVRFMARIKMYAVIDNIKTYIYGDLLGDSSVVTVQDISLEIGTDGSPVKAARTFVLQNYFTDAGINSYYKFIIPSGITAYDMQLDCTYVPGDGSANSLLKRNIKISKEMFPVLETEAYSIELLRKFSVILRFYYLSNGQDVFTDADVTITARTVVPNDKDYIRYAVVDVNDNEININHISGVAPWTELNLIDGYTTYNFEVHENGHVTNLEFMNNQLKNQPDNTRSIELVRVFNPVIRVMEFDIKDRQFVDCACSLMISADSAAMDNPWEYSEKERPAGTGSVTVKDGYSAYTITIISVSGDITRTLTVTQAELKAASTTNPLVLQLFTAYDLDLGVYHLVENQKTNEYAALPTSASCRVESEGGECVFIDEKTFSSGIVSLNEVFPTFKFSLTHDTYGAHEEVHSLSQLKALPGNALKIYMIKTINPIIRVMGLDPLSQEYVANYPYHIDVRMKDTGFDVYSADITDPGKSATLNINKGSLAYVFNITTDDFGTTVKTFSYKELLNAQTEAIKIQLDHLITLRLGVYITVKEASVLTTSAITIKASGTDSILYSNDAAGADIQTITIPGGYTAYNIEVVKKGYLTHSSTYKRYELNNVLEILLDPDTVTE